MSEAVAKRPKRRHPHRKDYTDREREIALTAMALCSGHRDKASKLAAKQGVKVPAHTIYDWAARSRTDEYARIREQVAPQLREQLADAHQGLARAAAKLEAETLDRLTSRLAQGDVEDKDLANILRNAAIAGGIHVEKAQLLNDRPTQIVKRSSEEILRDLASMGYEPAIEAEVLGEEDVAAAS